MLKDDTEYIVIEDVRHYEKTKQIFKSESLVIHRRGLSQREFLIKISEEWFKPVFGKDFYAKEAGEAAASELLWDNSVVFSDVGFQEEFDTIKSIVGKENILLVRLYREGINWNGDSRGYLKNPDWEVDIKNNGSVEEVVEYIKNEIKWKQEESEKK